MSMEQLVATVVLIGLLGVAVVSDLRRHRIPNLLILVGLALGLAGQTYSGGISGMGDGLMGLLIGFALFLPMYALGGMAAGDVKLMAMVGSFLPPITPCGLCLQSAMGRLVRFPDRAGARSTIADPGTLSVDASGAGLYGPELGGGGR